MRLPFTHEQFFDVFAAYNGTLWPGVLILWLASFAMSVLIAISHRRAFDRLVGALLVTHWAWSAFLYHGAFFTRINPAAWLFLALFLVEAGLLFRWGVIENRLRFSPRPSSWTTLAWLLVAYALAYPAINWAQHLTVSRIPTFGVPCPTTIFTAGLLILARPHIWQVSIIPVIWSVIGGSAAFLLGVTADYALPIAGIALSVSLFRSVE